jgi:hypothetical protein
MRRDLLTTRRAVEAWVSRVRWIPWVGWVSLGFPAFSLLSSRPLAHELHTGDVGANDGRSFVSAGLRSFLIF